MGHDVLKVLALNDVYLFEGMYEVYVYGSKNIYIYIFFQSLHKSA